MTGSRTRACGPPDPPGPAARKAFYRAIIGLTDEDRHRFKERLLAVDRQQVQAVAGRHFVREMATAVISGDEQLERANQRLEPTPLALYRI